MLYLKYQPNNWLTSQTLGSGVTTSYAYNPRGFLADLRTNAPQASGGAVISEFGGPVGTSAAMTYDGVGNRTQMTGTLNGVGGYQLLGNGPSSSQYAYNSANEVTQEQTTQPGNGSYTNAYTYDGAQNRTSLNGNAIGHTPDNQFSDTTHYGYDGNGNPTGYTSPGNPVSGSANVTTFDPENRMTGYGISGSSALLNASYDSDGLRASKTGSSGTTYYVYDQQDRPVVELNASGVTTFVNTFGDNGLLSRRDVANSLTTYYAFDPQGSAVDVMQGNTGTPSAYSAFGIPASGGASSSPFGFGAQWGYSTDAETGLVLCTHRYYDPYTGRFVNRDPTEHGVNWYTYCYNSPTRGIDPSGYACIINVDPYLGIGYAHAYIQFNVSSCDGYRSAGFWPASCGVPDPGPDPGIVCYPDPDAPDAFAPLSPTPVRKCIAKDDDPTFEKALCSCIAASKIHHHTFGVGSYVCGSWTHDMWACALKAAPVKPTPLMPPSGPSTPPSGGRRPCSSSLKL